MVVEWGLKATVEVGVRVVGEVRCVVLSEEEEEVLVVIVRGCVAVVLFDIEELGPEVCVVGEREVGDVTDGEVLGPAPGKAPVGEVWARKAEKKLWKKGRFVGAIFLEVGGSVVGGVR